MTNDFLMGVSMAIFIGVIVSIFMYIYYYKLEHQRHLIFWIIGWISYAARIAMLMLSLQYEWIIYSYFYDLFGIITALFILIGAHIYVKKQPSLAWIIITGLAIVWSLFARWGELPFLWLYLLPSLITGAMFIYAGWLFITHFSLNIVFKTIGFLFIIMGVHRMDYPFLRPIESFAAFGYLLNEFLMIAIAIGFGLIIYGSLKRDLNESENKYEALANSSKDLIYMLDLQGNILMVNAIFKQNISLGSKPIVNRHIANFFPHTTFSWDHAIHQVKTTEETLQEEYEQTKKGKTSYFVIRLTPIIDQHGYVKAVHGTHHDYTLFKEKEDTIKKMAFQDPLTEIPNNFALSNYLQTRTLRKEKRDPFTIIYIGLDYFRRINEGFGPRIADELLKQVAQVLKLEISDVSILVRYGGDEFVLVTDHHKKEHIKKKLIQLRESLNRTWRVAHHTIHISACYGIATYPKDGGNVELLLKHANLALNESKSRGANQSTVYHQKLTEKYKHERELETNILRAINDEEFVLYYQPQLMLEKEQLVAFEVLVRWKKIDGSFVHPDTFIPLAEKTGAIIPIGDYVFRKACKMVQFFHENYSSKIRICVNVSSIQLQQDDFVEKVMRIIREENADPHCIELELTESLLIQTNDKTIGKLQQLREHGVRISIDDFGTGFSSFHYLASLPIDLLKIDRSFIINMEYDNKKATMMRKLIDLVKELDIEVLAEGVENKEQLNSLKTWKCDIIQGFYYSKPLSETSAITFLFDELQSKKHKNDIKS
ncbi:putative bifunctional diguanylate cyclase/phosphodiesterase [Salipaludibacillus daqingensis]|uniref:putative bifunctional diguanylate cyclase/phosphodiesterase n=1 Tax=Salipaludibacillus daqingensis TaxID=3041001 RepID=UPI002472F85D|nr:EAL domain-containing protein [Salipaludibacillus daqingensis]